VGFIDCSDGKKLEQRFKNKLKKEKELDVILISGSRWCKDRVLLIQG